ncbi:MAG: hypothetical protein IT166_16815 [Bryobacterales bacterium]|nr:hypothetical protein [Bryobacterales bacterium]
MSNVISEYQKWKQQGETLRAQARQAMEARFKDLLAEAVQVAEEYRSDFGTALRPPAPVTAFRYKTGSKGKGRKAARKLTPPVAQEPPARPGPKVAGLEKRLAAARKKLEEAKAASKPVRNLEDRIYELEDELRLATQAG